MNCKESQGESRTLKVEQLLLKTTAVFVSVIKGGSTNSEITRVSHSNIGPRRCALLSN